MTVLKKRDLRILDLYCGDGGAGVGYSRAGFWVVGVDKFAHPRYPFDFVQMDAIEALFRLWIGWPIFDSVGLPWYLKDFDAIHASPPCQAYSNITPDKSKHKDMIPATRDLLLAIGKPYVIENVMGAIRHLRAPIWLCGMVFGLKVYRHRAFESNKLLLAPPHWPHRDNTPRAGHGVSSAGFISVTSGGTSLKVNPSARRRGVLPGVSKKGFVSVTGHITGVEFCRQAMDIDWMAGKGLSQAIPPAYTEYIGKQLISYIEAS